MDASVEGACPYVDRSLGLDQRALFSLHNLGRAADPKGTMSFKTEGEFPSVSGGRGSLREEGAWVVARGLEQETTKEQGKSRAGAGLNSRKVGAGQNRPSSKFHRQEQELGRSRTRSASGKAQEMAKGRSCAGE